MSSKSAVATMSAVAEVMATCPQQPLTLSLPFQSLVRAIHRARTLCPMAAWPFCPMVRSFVPAPNMWKKDLVARSAQLEIHLQRSDETDWDQRGHLLINNAE
eukprot:2812107-Pyramimonas_sp.AAC.1